MNTGRPPKKFTKRRRTKKLLKDIKEQVEFYFSDANLNRDSFMKDLVGTNGVNYVPINVILTFKQMKVIGASSNTLQKALQDSEYLLLSEDKSAVKRKSQTIQPPSRDVDNCTIFVECLPSNANVQWLKRICKRFGDVNYISLPRFKSGSVKGFAFVEFATVDAAISACSVINSSSGVVLPNIAADLHKPSLNFLPTKNDTGSELRNDNETSFQKESFPENVINNAFKTPSLLMSNHTKSFPSSVYNEVQEDSLCNATNTENDHKESKNFTLNCNMTEGEHADISEDDDHSTSNSSLKPTIKSKVTCVTDQKRKRAAEVPLKLYCETDYKKKLSESDFLKNSMTSTPKSVSRNKDIIMKLNNKKTRKRSRKRRCKSQSNKPSKVILLRAMMKSDWLELRNMYLHKQRENFGNLKSILQKCSSPDPETTSVYIKHHLALKKSATENYMDLSDNEAEEKDVQANSTIYKGVDEISSSKHEFIPGVVASVSSLSSNSAACAELKKLPNFSFMKLYFSQYGEVAYVDVKSGADRGFIRFKNSESAQRAILEDKQFGLCLLTGVQEEKYWDSLLVSRQLKRTRERKRRSGKQKLIIRAEHRIDLARTRHIKFNDDFHQV